MYDYRAKLSDRIRARGDDGDTVLMVIDLGMDVFTEQSIRLTAVTAPESYQLGGIESARMLRMMLDEIADRARARKLRWPFVILTDPNTNPEPDERRTFTRWLGRVFPFDAAQTMEQSVNDQMIAFLRSHPEWGDGITVPFRPRDEDG